jgi:phytoene dehydrogenase-like protein
VVASFVPYRKGRGPDAAWSQALGERVLKTLERYAPGITSQVVARQVLTPNDLEAAHGLSGGHLYHGEHAMDQLSVLRPSVDCGHYRTPLGGLYLCGSGSHPGGGITCAPGALAAAAILKHQAHGQA